MHDARSAEVDSNHLLGFLSKPYALLFGLFLSVMVSISFDIPAIHDASMAARWPVLGLMALAGVFQFGRHGIGRLPTSTISLALLILVATASSFWSRDFDYTFQRAGSLVLLFIAMLGVTAYCQDRENARALFDVMWWLAAGLAVGGFLFRLGESGSGGRYVGLHNRATGAGSYAALLLPIAFCQIRTRLRGLSLFLGIVVVLALFGQIILSGARMAAATSLFVALALAFFYYGRRAMAAIVVLSILAPIPLLLDARGVNQAEESGKKYLRVESFGTFTGRLDRWQYGIEKWLEQPIQGYGLGSSRTLAGVDEPWRFNLEPGEVFNLHSDQIEVLMDLGLVGFIPFALFWMSVLTVGFGLIRRSNDEGRWRGLAAGGAAFYAFGDTFMHGGFLAAGGGVSAFSWSLIGIMMAMSQWPATELAIHPRHASAPQAPHPQPRVRQGRTRVIDRHQLPSIRDVVSNAVS